MSGIEVRPFRRSDRQQLTDLVNAHVQAVVPGMSVSVNAVLVGSWLLGEAAEWLRLGRVDRLLGYADRGAPGFLERSGFRRLTETVRDWALPPV